MIITFQSGVVGTFRHTCYRYEEWLNAGKNSCELTVIPCFNYTPQTITPSLATNPSPNIVNAYRAIMAKELNGVSFWGEPDFTRALLDR